MRRSPWICLALTSLLCSPTLAAEKPPQEYRRIVFLGDSITYAGQYVEFVEAALRLKNPGMTTEFLDIGLPSETVSGLSEPGHAGGAFPRPTLHERLDRVLAKAKPDLIVACYGMNDGIYYPLDEKRTKAFQDGMIKLHDKVTATGARIIHVTPPVFDPLPIKSRVLPAGRDRYEQPFEGYNSVLDAYSEWLLAQRKAMKWEVIDVHGPMNHALAEQRKTNPQFTYARDGIHPSPEGHLVIARVFLNTWGLKVKLDGTPDHVNGAAILSTIHKKQDLLRYAWLSSVGHKRPGVPKGLPLAEAEKQAATLDAEAHRLAHAK